MFGGFRMGKSVPADPHQASVARLTVARYLFLAMAAAVLVLKLIQVLWLGRDLTFRGGLEVFLISGLFPALVWVVSWEELRLRKDVLERNRQLRERARELEERVHELMLRNRETSALNRMMQAHLAACLPSDERGADSVAGTQSVTLRVSRGREPTNGHAALIPSNGLGAGPRG